MKIILCIMFVNMVTPKTRVFYNFLEHARDRRVCRCPRSTGIEDIWDTNASPAFNVFQRRPRRIVSTHLSAPSARADAGRYTVASKLCVHA